MILLLVFVVPQFTVLFAGHGRRPAAADPDRGRRRGISSATTGGPCWPLIALIALVILERWLQDEQVRDRLDQRVLGLPLFGDLIWKMETARLAHTLSTLLKNGLPLLSALNLAKEVVSNRKIAGLLDEAGEELKHGRGLAGPLARLKALPDLALQMIRVGEESGALDAMLAKVADIYDRETRTSVQRMLTLLEPVLIIGLGVVVAGIIISILMAILGANELVM